MKKILLFIVIISLMANVPLGFSQNPQWVVYDTTNSGLPSNYIRAIAIDSNGHKWIGTNKGIVKFDGTNWISITPGLPCSNIINSIVFDNNGNVWISTFGNGDCSLSSDCIMKFDGDTIWQWYKGGGAVTYIRDLYIDSNQDLWFGADANCFNGLAKFDMNTTWTYYGNFFTPQIGDPDYTVNDIIEDGNGNIWVGSIAGGLAKFDGISSWTYYNDSISGIPSNFVISIAIDQNNTKWIGTTGGLAKFDGASWVVFDTINSGLPGNEVTSITIEGNIKWIGTRKGGLAKYDDVVWAVYDTGNSGLPNNNVTSIVIDGNGNKWIGTGGGGVAVFNELGVGVEENGVSKSSAPQLTVYPNPVNEMVTIRYETTNDGIVSLGFYDLKGSLVDDLTNQITTSEHNAVYYSVGKFNDGVYYLRLQTQNYTTTKKIVVIH